VAQGQIKQSATSRNNSQMVISYVPAISLVLVGIGR
jgi:hypothetical protein